MVSVTSGSRDIRPGARYHPCYQRDPRWSDSTEFRGMGQGSYDCIKIFCYSYRFPHEKIHSLENTKDGLLVLRHITSQKLKPVYYRENRPHMLAENIKFEMEESSVSHSVIVH